MNEKYKGDIINGENNQWIVLGKHYKFDEQGNIDNNKESIFYFLTNYPNGTEICYILGQDIDSPYIDDEVKNFSDNYNSYEDLEWLRINYLITEEAIIEVDAKIPVLEALEKIVSKIEELVIKKESGIKGLDRKIKKWQSIYKKIIKIIEG